MGQGPKSPKKPRRRKWRIRKKSMDAFGNVISEKEVIPSVRQIKLPPIPSDYLRSGANTVWGKGVQKPVYSSPPPPKNNDDAFLTGVIVGSLFD